METDKLKKELTEILEFLRDNRSTLNKTSTEAAISFFVGKLFDDEEPLDIYLEAQERTMKEFMNYYNVDLVERIKKMMSENHPYDIRECLMKIVGDFISSVGLLNLKVLFRSGIGYIFSDFDNDFRGLVSKVHYIEKMDLTIIETLKEGAIEGFHVLDKKRKRIKSEYYDDFCQALIGQMFNNEYFSAANLMYEKSRKEEK